MYSGVPSTICFMLTYVGDALKAFFFARDGVFIRGIVILLNFAFEDPCVGKNLFTSLPIKLKRSFLYFGSLCHKTSKVFVSVEDQETSFCIAVLVDGCEEAESQMQKAFPQWRWRSCRCQLAHRQRMIRN